MQFEWITRSRGLARPWLPGCWAMLAPIVGCSALIAPDPSRLGGSLDGGGIDAPDPNDALRLDAPGLDAPSPGPGPDAADDGGPRCPASCADEHDCTLDRCVDGLCVHEPDDSRCPEGRCSPVLGCVPRVCTTNEECDDGNRCNGAERCEPSAGTPSGCVPASAPLDCNDGVACTEDSCAPDRGCVHVRIDARCDDGLACTRDVCAGTAGPSGCEHRADDALCNRGCVMGARCVAGVCMGGVPRMCADDGNPCTVERCDEGAGGCVADPLDADGDMFPAMVANRGDRLVRCEGGTDCDDSRASVNPGAREICGNGLDDDCNPATPDVCPGVPGDSCANPLPLTIRDGMGSVTLSLDRFANDYTTNCGGAGNDAVYVFEVRSPSDVRIETSGDVDTVLATAFTCSAEAFRDRCNDDRDPGSGDASSRIWLRRVEPPFGGVARVFVLVDDYGASDTDSTTLTVTVTPISPDTCPTSGMGPRPLDISGGGVVFGRTAAVTGSLGSSQTGSCQGTGARVAPEAIFRIVEEDRTLSRIEAVGFGFIPDLYVRQGTCASGSEIGCVNGIGRMGGGSAVLEGLSGTRSDTLFYAFVDNAPLAGADYRVTYDP